MQFIHQNAWLALDNVWIKRQDTGGEVSDLKMLFLIDGDKEGKDYKVIRGTTHIEPLTDRTKMVWTCLDKRQ